MSNAMQNRKEVLEMIKDDMYDPALHGALISLLLPVHDSDRWGEPMNTSHESIAYHLRLLSLTYVLIKCAKN